MKDLNKFHIESYVETPEPGVIQKKYICVRPTGIPFDYGTEFIPWCVSEYLGCLEETALQYLGDICQFLNYLQELYDENRFLAPSNEIRRDAIKYLEERLCTDVRPHPDGYKVIYPTGRNKEKGQITIGTAKLAVQSLKTFYVFLNEKGYYRDPNPFLFEKGILAKKASFNPSIPPKSGIALPYKQGRMPETYFCFARGQWEPKDINDPLLQNKIIDLFKSEELGDRIIARILFEGGPRIHEIFAINIGDWRALHSLRPGTKAINKGEYGLKVKEVYWSVETDRMIFNYCNHQRKQFDRFHRGLSELPDDEPLFINKNGNRQTYSDFYFVWSKICKKGNLHLTPHQVRHWFVTRVLENINNTPEDSEVSREKLRRAFIAYMHWHNPKTIEIYDHLITKRSVPEIYDDFFLVNSPEQSTTVPEKPVVEIVKTDTEDMENKGKTLSNFRRFLKES